jgi:hypothetical protein
LFHYCANQQINQSINQSIISLSGTATAENEILHRSLLAARIANDKKNGKKAVNAPPVNIGWDSHQPVVSYIITY